MWRKFDPSSTIQNNLATNNYQDCVYNPGRVSFQFHQVFPVLLNNDSFIFTARKRSLQRLCFYRCLSVHRGVCLLPGGCLLRWGGLVRRCLLPGHLVRGGCLLPVGVPGPRGVWSRGCLVETPRTATAAGGTHPTGMHSCLFNILYLTYG